VRARNPHGDKYTLLDKLIQENVLLQLHHLQTHPAVAGRVAEGKLALYAWVYEIGEGLVKEYQPERKEFVSVV
jgi:carbonic anhydrase